MKSYQFMYNVKLCPVSHWDDPPFYEAWQVLYFAAMRPPGGGRNFITPRVAWLIFTARKLQFAEGVVQSHCWITGRY